MKKYAWLFLAVSSTFVFGQNSAPAVKKRVKQESDLADFSNVIPHTKSDVQQIVNAKHENQSLENQRYFNEGYEWINIGPKDFLSKFGVMNSGAVVDIESRYNNAIGGYDYLRALSSSGGLWERDFINGSWNNITANLTTNIGCFTTIYNSKDTIVVGTGDYRSERPSTGIFYTTNGGATWQPSTINRPQMYSKMRSMVFRKDKPYIGYTGTTTGLLITYDYGVTWDTVAAFGRKSIERVMIEDTDYDVDAHENPSVVYVSVRNEGLYSFQSGIAQLVSLPYMSYASSVKQVELAFDPANSDNVYVGINFHNTLNNIYGTYIHKSTDHGLTWTPCRNAAGTADLVVGGNDAFNTICIDPAEPNHVIIGGVEMFKSLNGINFSEVNTSMFHSDVSKVIRCFDKENMFYIACDGGFFLYNMVTDAVYTEMNSMPIVQPYDFSVSRTNTEPTILLSLQDNGTVYKRATDSFWRQNSEQFSDGMTGAVHPFNNNWMFGFESPNNGLSRAYTTTNGTDWNVTPETFRGFTNIFTDFNPGHIHFYFTDSVNVYASDDLIGWPGYPFSFPSTPVDPTQYRIIKGAASSDLIPALYFAVQHPDNSLGDQVLLVYDGSVVRNISDQVPGPVKNLKTIYPRNNWIVTCHTAGSYVAADPIRRIMFSTNRGVSFTPMAGDLPAYAYVQDAFVNPYDTTNLYVATDKGVYVSYNYGENWSLWDLNMPYDADVRKLDYVDNMATDGTITLIASTFGNSLWARIIPPTSAMKLAATQKSESFVTELMQPYTDGSGQLQIEYFLERGGQCKLAVYNYLGQEVRSIKNENMQMGNYKLTENISSLAPGVYVLNMMAGGKTISRKFVVHG